MANARNVVTSIIAVIIAVPITNPFTGSVTSMPRPPPTKIGANPIIAPAPRERSKAANARKQAIQSASSPTPNNQPRTVDLGFISVLVVSPPIRQLAPRCLKSVVSWEAQRGVRLVVIALWHPQTSGTIQWIQNGLQFQSYLFRTHGCKCR